MVDEYGLREVWFPEAKYVGPGPKCNIFMSEEFYNGDVKANSSKTALVLI